MDNQPQAPSQTERGISAGAHGENRLFAACIFFVLLTFALEALLTQSPTYKAADTPVTEFSGQRAFHILEMLLEENVPHPTGSEANKRIKKRIRQWLGAHGIESEVQEAWGCHPTRGRCAWVENIIATIPGEIDGPHVTLMSHYDSVGASPGAADNGLGTAIIMEVARMLKSQGKNRNPIMLVITDGEEDSLMGAEAFFEQHPLARSVGVVLNLEASGTKGDSYLFRTGSGNATLLELYKSSAAYPRGTSFYNEVFRLLPSDTDLSVPKRLGIPGVDFGFTGEKNHQHTPNDEIRNLSPTTIQHHGENMYSLAKPLSLYNLGELAGDDVLYDNYYGLFFSWSQATNNILLAISFLLLAAASRASKISPRSMIGPFLTPLALLITTIVCLAGLIIALHFVRGATPFWPAHIFPYRTMLFAVPILIGLLFAQKTSRTWTIDQALLGVWWFWWSTALLFAIFLPDASHLFTVPALGAALVCAAAQRCSAGQRLWVYPLSLLMVVPTTIPKILILESSLGYWLIIITTLFFALLVSSLLPFARGQLARLLRNSCLAVLLVAVGLSLWLPSFSETRPQRMIYQLIQNDDLDAAWLRFISLNPLPQQIARVRPFSDEAAIYPWGKKLIGDLSETESEDVQAPIVEVYPLTASSGKRLRLTLSTQRKAMWMGLVIPQSSGLITFEIEGRSYPVDPANWSDWQDNYVLEFRGVQNKQVDVTLNFSSVESVEAFLFDVSPTIPERFSPELEAQSAIAVEANGGHRFMNFHRISL